MLTVIVTHANYLAASATWIKRMGDSAVYVTPNKLDPSTAFVACGADFCRIRLPSRDSSVCIDSIWLDDPQNLAFLQGALSAMDQVPSTAHSSKELSGFIFAVFGDRMVYAQLDYDTQWTGQAAPHLSYDDGKIIPRKLSTTQTPLKLLVAEDLPHHLIVVTNEFIPENIGGTNGPSSRLMLSNIKVIDLLGDRTEPETEIRDESMPGTPKSKVARSEIPLKHYERVHSMVRWVYSNEKGRYHTLLLVGTEIKSPGGGSKGRRLVLNISKSGLKLQDQKRFDGPVRCIAGYDDNHIVSIVGSTLQIESLEGTKEVK